MKLVAIATVLVASMSLIAGCATDNDGEGGGFTAGLHPAKLAKEDLPNPYPPVSDAVVDLVNGNNDNDVTVTPELGQHIVVETIPSPFPIHETCKGCDLAVVRSPLIPGELSVLDDAGNFVCHIWLDGDSQVKSTDCQ